MRNGFVRLGGVQTIFEGGTDTPNGAKIAALAGGGYVLNWNHAKEGSASKAFGQVYSDEGVKIGARFQNSWAGDNNGGAGGLPSVALTGGGIANAFGAFDYNNPVFLDHPSHSVFANVRDAEGKTVSGTSQVNREIDYYATPSGIGTLEGGAGLLLSGTKSE